MPVAIEPLHPMTAAERCCINTLRQALDLCDELDAAREQYDGAVPRLSDSEGQPALPFLFNQIARA